MNLSIPTVIPPNVPSSRKNNISFEKKMITAKFVNDIRKDSLVLQNGVIK